jgi:hypothetical protein
MSLVSADRRSRSKVRAWIVGSWSICWVQVLEDWGASIEAVVEDIQAQFKDIRHLITSMPTITVVKALELVPCEGSWISAVGTLGWMSVCTCPHCPGLHSCHLPLQMMATSDRSIIHGCSFE